MREGAVAQVAGRAGGGQHDRGVAGVRRVNGRPAAPGPGEVVARPAFAASVAGLAWRPGRGHVVVPRIGLVFPHQLPFEAWLGVGAQLAAVAASSAWCLGDWLAYGQAAYGSRYREAVERTGLDYQTLRNYAWVAGRFELSRRRDSLSFGHHAEVAALPGPEQDFWLRKAEQFGWPVRRLRREVRASLAERRQGPAALEPADPATGHPDGQQVTLAVRLTPGQLDLCQQAAGQHGMPLTTWATRTLEHAAHHSLQHRTGDHLATT
jgi:hypothetical protein